METYKWVIVVILSVATTIAAYFYQHNKALCKFRENIKIGDKCSVYIGEDRHGAIVTKVLGNCVWVRIFEESKSLKFYRGEIYF